MVERQRCQFTTHTQKRVIPYDIPYNIVPCNIVPYNIGFQVSFMIANRHEKKEILKVTSWTILFDMVHGARGITHLLPPLSALPPPSAS